MILCHGPDKIFPYQIDFGAAYLCYKLDLQTPDAFYDVANILLMVHMNAINPSSFDKECQKIHPHFARLLCNFNHYDSQKKCYYRLTSPITSSFIDDLCYFVWHHGNLQWEIIAASMFNGQSNKCAKMYIKNIFINACCFKVPEKSLSSLYQYIYTQVLFLMCILLASTLK